MRNEQKIILRNSDRQVLEPLPHVESQTCWCDPIVELDDYGNRLVIHKEITWH